MNPEISTVSLQSDNTTIAVTFNEPVYTATGATTALVTSDFALSITGGTATLSSATPSSISISGNTYTLGIPLSGTPNGNEVLTVVPSSASAIYDASNNAASITQLRNTVYLNDKTPPKIISANVAYNKDFIVTFDEPIFGSAVLNAVTANDFVYSIAEGTATLGSTTPSSISTQAPGGTGKHGTGFYGSENSGYKFLLGLNISGTANGKEKITVAPVANSLFDAMGNAVSTTQAAGADSLAQEKLVPLSNGYEFNKREARDASVVHLRDSIYVVAYAGESGDGFIQTFSVSEDGKRMSKIDEDEHDGDNGWDNSLVKADDNTVVLAYRGLRYERGVIKTFTIDSNGKIKEEDDLTHDNSYGLQNSLIKVSHDIYALAYSHRQNYQAKLVTFKIPADGSSITETRQINTSQYSNENSLVKAGPGVIILASGGYQDHNRRSSNYGNWIKTYSISDDGKTITGIASKNHDTGAYAYNENG